MLLSYQLAALLQIFIANEWLDAEDGATFPVYNPSTTELICQVSLSNKVLVFYDFAKYVLNEILRIYSQCCSYFAVSLLIQTNQPRAYISLMERTIVCLTGIKAKGDKEIQRVKDKICYR